MAQLNATGRRHVVRPAEPENVKLTLAQKDPVFQQPERVPEQDIDMSQVETPDASGHYVSKTVQEANEREEEIRRILGNQPATTIAPPPQQNRIPDITKAVEDENNDTIDFVAPPKQNKISAVNTGPVDFSNMQKMDVHEAIPDREPEIDPFIKDQFDALDKRIEEHKVEISQLQKEAMAQWDAEREAYLQEQKDAELGIEPGQNGSSSDEDCDTGLYEDEEDEDEEMIDFANPNKDIELEVEDAPVQTVQEMDESFDDRPSLEELKEDIVDELGLDPDEELMDEDEEDETPVTTFSPPRKIMQAPSHYQIDESDIENESDLTDAVEEEELSDEELELQAEQIISEFREDVNSRIIKVAPKKDLSQYKIREKPISINNVMKNIKKSVNVADWVLWTSRKPISMSEFSARDIIKLDPNQSNRSTVNKMKDIYQVFYDHIIDSNKPSFEVWLKTVKFTDQQSLYFAAYMATFGESNFQFRTCEDPKCSNMFLTELTFEDMVKYDSDEIKAEVSKVLKRSSSEAVIESDLVQISDNYVFAIKSPSIWNIAIEISMLSEGFLSKYETLVENIACIENVYIIDENTQQLVPVDTKPDSKDATKTLARKIQAYGDIINTLSSDEYNELLSEIYQRVTKKGDDITYILPECECPKCKKKVPANTEIGADGLLFLRHRLGTFGNI